MSDREAEILEGTVALLRKHLSPSRIIHFGSRARNINGKHSDFDFAVDCRVPEISIQREIKEDIEGISGLYKVDVVYMPSVDDAFKDIILKTGKVVYERGD